MKREQIENIYKTNGIKNYKLRNTDELLKVHGIDFREVQGYNRLDDIRRAIYEKFIVNIFNNYGLESRSKLIPKGIYYVEHTERFAKSDSEEDVYVLVDWVIMVIDRSGLRSLLRMGEDEEFKHLEIVDQDTEKYIRFEYELGESNIWLHVIDENKWY